MPRAGQPELLVGIGALEEDEPSGQVEGCLDGHIRVLDENADYGRNRVRERVENGARAVLGVEHAESAARREAKRAVAPAHRADAVVVRFARRVAQGAAQMLIRFACERVPCAPAVALLCTRDALHARKSKQFGATRRAFLNYIVSILYCFTTTVEKLTMSVMPFRQSGEQMQQATLWNPTQPVFTIFNLLDTVLSEVLQ